MERIKSFDSFISEGMDMAKANKASISGSSSDEIVNSVYKEGLKVPQEVIDGPPLAAYWLGYKWNGVDESGKTYVWDMTGVLGVPSGRSNETSLNNPMHPLISTEKNGILAKLDPDVYAGVHFKMKDVNPDPNMPWIAFVSKGEERRYYGHMVYTDKMKKIKCVQFDTDSPTLK